VEHETFQERQLHASVKLQAPDGVKLIEGLKDWYVYRLAHLFLEEHKGAITVAATRAVANLF
jgi:hypothetical protein